MRPGPETLTVNPAARARTAGFTLLELLVVIFIVAVLVGLVVPNLARSEGRDVSEAAERLVLLLNRARQEAMLSTRIWRVEFDPEAAGYRFHYYAGNNFQPVSASPFRGEHPAGVELDEIEVNGQLAVAEAQVLLFPTGEQDSLNLSLRSGERERQVSMGPVGPAEVRLP